MTTAIVLLTTAQVYVPMPQDTNRHDKDTIDRSRVFAVYNVYRLVIGSVLFALFLSTAADQTAGENYLNQQLMGAGLLVLSSIILAFIAIRTPLDSEPGIFSVLLLDVVATTLIAHPNAVLGGGFSALYLVTVAAASMLLRDRQLATLVAALATLSILVDTVFHLATDTSDQGGLLAAGLRGILIFVVSWIGQIVTANMTVAERRAQEATSEAERLQELNDEIVEHIQTGILAVSRDDQVRAVNDAARDLLNLGHRGAQAVGSIDPNLALALEEWRAGGGQRPKPFQPKGVTRTVLPRFTSIDETRAGEALLFIDDYTPMTQFAQSLKLNSLGRLTGSIAHEIRNPLAAVSNAVQLLAENPNMNESDRALTAIMLNNTQRINDTVNHVLELSRRVPPDFKALNLDTWVPDYLEEFKEGRADQPTIYLQQETPVSITADEKQLKRVLDNLLDNALRHSELKTGQLEAHLAVSASPSSNLCHLDIIDFGDGVPESSQSRLFEPFFTTSASGTGLGLYLCKELCESNGADLRYRRTDSGESAFRVSLQLEKGVM
ncbi:MAG: sensor histidine kinase [Luminiphilus sp.]